MKVCIFENYLEKSRVATEYIHATPTLRPAYFHFAVYVEMSYSRYRSSVNETGIIGTQGSNSLCEVSDSGFIFVFVVFTLGRDPEEAPHIIKGEGVFFFFCVKK